MFITAVGLWAGAGVLFSAIILPTIFLNLEVTAAGATAALLFPGYYAFGVIVGLIVTASAMYFARTRDRVWATVLVAAAIATACHAYATFEIRPRMAELRGVTEGAGEFQQLHRLSVRLNGIVLLVSLGLLVGSSKLIERR